MPGEAVLYPQKTTMKKLSLIIGVAAIVLATITGQAQTVTTVTTNASGGLTTTTGDASTSLAPASFLTSVQNYFTSFNTNSTTFQKDRVELWSGMDQGTALSAVLGVTVVLPKSFFAEAVFENATVAGALESGAVGGGYSYVLYDLKVSGGVDGGYRFDARTAYVEPFIDARKALTAHTFAGTRLYYQQGFSDKVAHNPGVFLIGGVTF